MVQAESDALGCVCTACGYRCRDCLGTDTVVTPDRLRTLAFDPRFSPEALAEAILALKNDPEGRTAMGLRGRRIAEEQFDRPVSYLRIIRMADELLGVEREW